MQRGRTSVERGGAGPRAVRSADRSPVALFTALSDPTRLRLLQLLRTGETCVCDLVAALEAPQPTVSRHLAVLRAAGFVRARREGAWMHYSLAEPTHDLDRAIRACLDACTDHDPTFATDRRRRIRARQARGCCD